MLQIYCL